jgi:Reverse transcriptase (RNA-dependent DNA polymerase)
MLLSMLKPTYPYKPIGSIALLARTLGMTSDRLQDLSSQANALYRDAKPILKPDGSIRQPLDAKPELKEIHRRLKEQLLLKVVYPPYLTGSLKGTEPKKNAEMHAGKCIVICEDIRTFFPSVTAQAVRNVWQGVFGFPPAVALLLTALTTKDGRLPQGAITSSYLANLILWEHEPQLCAEFASQGITYSRYVDDISISSAKFMTKEQQTQAIARIYGMLAKAGLKPKRSKHETYSRSQRMMTTKLVVNKKPSLPAPKRSQIRAAVHRLEQDSAGLDHRGALPNLLGVSVRVGQLNRFNPGQAAPLQVRLKKLRVIRQEGASEFAQLVQQEGAQPAGA